MVIELWGGSFINKGAELMLLAAIRQIREWDPHHRVTAHLRGSTFRQRAAVGLSHRPWLESHKYASQALKVSHCMDGLARALRIPKLVPENDVDAVLDLSGFAFSDQWGSANALRMAWLSKRWKRQGKKLIFLPQAFGPFRVPENREAFQKVLREADLVYARDPVSLRYLLELGESSAAIRMAPDFTGLLEGVVPEYAGRINAKVAIVPNMRMMDKMSAKAGQEYLDMLELLGHMVWDMGKLPAILVHELHDVAIARKLQARLGKQRVELINESDPLKIKGLMRQFDFIIGSRFHALVSALSQGVPVIGTGWSHKYEMLFADYDCSDFLVPPNASPPLLDSLLAQLSASNEAALLKKRIESCAENQKMKIRKMWEEVRVVLET